MSGRASTVSQEFLSLSLPSNTVTLTGAKNIVLFAFLASLNNCIKVESIPLTLIQLYIKDRYGQVCAAVIILLARKFQSRAQYKICAIFKKHFPHTHTPNSFSMPLKECDKFINSCQPEHHDPGFFFFFLKQGRGILKNNSPLRKIYK